MTYSWWVRAGEVGLPDRLEPRRSANTDSALKMLVRVTAGASACECTEMPKAGVDARRL